MLSLLVVVFLLQLAIHLINTIGAKQINDLLWQLSSRFPIVSSSSSVQAKEQIRLRGEVVRLKREMNAISAQDDFARWAKIRREHDKVLGQHDKVASQLSSARSSFDTKASTIRWVSTTGLRFGLQFWHAKTPVFELPSGWFPWWVEWILGFPRCPYGGVSINVWSGVCAYVIILVSDLTAWTIAQITGSSEEQTQKNGGREKVKLAQAQGVAAGKKTS